MNATLYILPRLQAAASRVTFRTRGSLAEAAEELRTLKEAPAEHGLRVVPAGQSAAAFEPGVRKGPQRLATQRLGLVQAAAVLEMPVRPKRLPQQVGGVDFAFYRTYTEAMLRRYSKLSMESGRVPSLLGRELFRGHVTSCKVHSFEDVSNFVLDMERAMEQLAAGQRHLLRRIAVEEYTREETAALCGLSLRTVNRHYGDALDKMTRVLLERKLLEPLAVCGC